MNETSCYESPLGKIFLEADEWGLTGLAFEGQKGFPAVCSENDAECESVVLRETKRWLSVFFSGNEPPFSVPLHLTGTKFQMEVWEILRGIPYGKTVTYGEIAKQISGQRNGCAMSAQAVGRAVGHNPVSLIVPCHRVIGADGNLTGYAGGIWRKERLLSMEKAAASAETFFHDSNIPDRERGSGR